MMTFEEKFPGLHTEYIGFDKECENGKLILVKTYSETEITKHCLDKQKVREAIQNYVFNGGSPAHAKDILKELGL